MRSASKTQPGDRRKGSADAPRSTAVSSTSGPAAGLVVRLFPTLFGAFLGLTLLKFGTPPIFEDMLTSPGNGWELVFSTPWPIAWAYGLLALVVLCGLAAISWKSCRAWWLPALTFGWLLWQTVAAGGSVDRHLSGAALGHFAACAVCFWLGFFALSQSKRLVGFWLGLLAGFTGVLAVGWWDHFGGLEETRRYFYAYHDPQKEHIPPLLLKRILSDRIFSTLFYPNTLAGALVLLFPPLFTFLASAKRSFTLGARAFLLSCLSLATLGCLYWSGSKGGWLLLLLLGIFALLRLDFPRQLKVALVAVVLLTGMAGFFWKYSGFFKKGATSVVARFDYWRAASQIVLAHPVLGTGPGTFGIAYKQIKPSGAEMAQLAHNDYLEQASDSGLPGALLYLVFVGSALACGFPKGERGQSFGLWLGLLGWAVHSSFEFVLYVPALAWPAFAFLGWLTGRPRNATAA